MAVPTKRAIDLVVVMCDECKKNIQVTGAHAALPAPWREVEMKGWVGVMHACSDGCEAGIRVRHEDATPTQPTPLPETQAVDDEEDTVP